MRRGRLPFDCSRPPLDADGLEELQCEGEEVTQTPVKLEIPVQRGEATNRRPDIEALRMDDDTLPEPSSEVRSAPREGCPAGLREVPAGGAGRMLTIRAADGSSQTYTTEVGDPPETVMRREELLVSHFTTAGELERQFTSIEPGKREGTVGWNPPPASEVSGSGRLVRFYFVLRDGRGGVASAVRALCVRK